MPATLKIAHPIHMLHGVYRELTHLEPGVGKVMPYEYAEHSPLNPGASDEKP